MEGIRRFEPISRNHKGFVDILQIGEDKGGSYFYYVMEVADDCAAGQAFDPGSYQPRNLEVVLKEEGPMPFAGCVELGLTLTEALQHLHEQKLVHRDIKPSNIIFVNGAAKLADIGLVTGISDELSYVGTEGYIPPEGPGTPQADIFGLGKVLYEASTGKDRTEFPTPGTALYQAQPRPELLELNAVVLRACAPRREDRYTSSQAFHDDLRVLQNGRSVRRLHELEAGLSRLKRFALVVAVLGAVTFLLYQPYRIRGLAERSKKQTEIGTDLALAARAQKDGDYFQAARSQVSALRNAQTLGQSEENIRLGLGTTLMLCPKLVGLLGFGGPVGMVQFTPDAAGLLLPRELKEGSLHLTPWQGTDPERQRVTFGPALNQLSAFHSRDGKRIVSGGLSQHLYLWDAETRNLLHQIEVPEWTSGCAISPDGSKFACGTWNGGIRIFDSRDGRLLSRTKPHKERVRHIEFSPDGRWLASCSHDKTIQVWDAIPGERPIAVMEHASWVFSVNFSADGTLLASSSLDRTARIWSTKTWKETVPPMLHEDGVRSISFSPDGQYALTTCYDFKGRLWDIRTGLLVPPVLPHDSHLTWGCFSPDGRLIATSTFSGSVYVWDLVPSENWSFKEARHIQKDGITLEMLGRRIVAKDAEGHPLGKPIESGIEPGSVELVSDASTVLVWQPPGTNEQTGKLELWDLARGARTLEATPASLPGNRSASHGRKLAIARDRSVRVFDQETRSFSPEIVLPKEIQALCFNHAGTAIAVACPGDFLVWDLAGGKKSAARSHLPGQQTDLQFSQDDTLVGYALSDKDLNPLWSQVVDARDGAVVTGRLRHGDGVLSIRFSPSGGRVVTTSEDTSAVLWDLHSSKPIFRPLLHKEHVLDARFSDGEEFLITTSRDGTLRIWDAGSGLLISPPIPTLIGPVGVIGELNKNGMVRLRNENREGDEAQVTLDLPHDTRPLADLELQTKLLSGAKGDYDAGPTPPAELIRMHRELAGRSPEFFSYDPKSQEKFHQLQLRSAQQKDNWGAIAFHAGRLEKLGAGDARIRGLAAEAAAKLRNPPPEKR